MKINENYNKYFIVSLYTPAYSKKNGRQKDIKQNIKWYLIKNINK